MLVGISGCNSFPFLHPGEHGAPNGRSPHPEVLPPVLPVDPINTVAIDAESTCGVAEVDNAPVDMIPLTNKEYDLTIADLLSTAVTPSSAFPPDATGVGFDTGAAHSMTTTMAQGYLDVSQSLAAAYVSSADAECLDQGFAASCTAGAVATFAQRAFRRPLLPAEQARMSALPTLYAATGLLVKEAYSAALATVLLAPQFLYRSKLSELAEVAHADQYALASKLSYALWASMPDSALLAQAKAGQLSRPDVLAGEIDRMIASPRSRGFLRNFTSQWLGTKGLAQAPAASQLDAALIDSLNEETLAYVGEFLEQNLNVRDLLDARFTYANASLATHYGLPAMTSEQMTRVAISGSQRGGLLTQGSFLLQTSNPDSTSPVKRGKWVLDRLLCSPPPPPPAGVQTVLAPNSGKALPMRQRLAAHRAQAACAGCHVAMDPIGLGLENYGLTGQWRDKDDYGPIDASGTLPGGASFGSAADLAAVLKADAAFPRCLANRLATYALRRAPTAQETCLIEKIAARTSEQSYGMRNLLVDLSRALLVN